MNKSAVPWMTAVAELFGRRGAAMLLSPHTARIAFVAVLLATRSLPGVLLAGIAFWGLRRLPARWPTPADWRAVPPDARSLSGHASAEARGVGSLGEIGMGGPNYLSYVLPDGAVLHDVALDDPPRRRGTLYVATRLRRSGSTPVVYDSVAHTVHELAGLPAADADIQAACAADPAPVALHRIHGLLVAAPAEAPPPMLERRLPSGRLLTATLQLPPDLRGAADPLALLSAAPYRLSVDGRLTDLYVADLQHCTESPSGALFIVPGLLLQGCRVSRTLWHIGWHDTFFTADANANDATGAGALYYLLAPQGTDDGRITWRAEHWTWGPDGNTVTLPPPVVALRVHWQRAPLLADTHEGLVTLQLPARLPAYALDYWC